MRIQTTDLWLRIGATVLAIAWAIVGAFSLHMSGEAPNADLAGRAYWMGITFLIAAIAAVAVSWLVRDLSNIWCIPAKKAKLTRLNNDDP